MRHRRRRVFIDTLEGRVSAGFTVPGTADAADVSMRLRERGWTPYRLRPDREQNAWIAVVIDWERADWFSPRFTWTLIGDPNPTDENDHEGKGCCHYGRHFRNWRGRRTRARKDGRPDHPGRTRQVPRGGHPRAASRQRLGHRPLRAFCRSLTPGRDET